MSTNTNMFTKCRWVYPNGSRCMQRSQYIGNFCKRHCLGPYEYNPDGIRSEGCGNVHSRSVRTDTIKAVETYSEHKFVGRGGVRYEYVSSSVSYVTMRSEDTGEEVVFWKDTEARDRRAGGQLIASLSTLPFDDYCEDLAVVCVSDEYYCKDCFEHVFRCKIRSLVPTVEDAKDSSKKTFEGSEKIFATD